MSLSLFGRWKFINLLLIFFIKNENDQNHSWTCNKTSRSLFLLPYTIANGKSGCVCVAVPKSYAKDKTQILYNVNEDSQDRHSRQNEVQQQLLSNVFVYKKNGSQSSGAGHGGTRDICIHIIQTDMSVRYYMWIKQQPPPMDCTLCVDGLVDANNFLGQQQILWFYLFGWHQRRRHRHSHHRHRYRRHHCRCSLSLPSSLLRCFAADYYYYLCGASVSLIPSQHRSAVSWPFFGKFGCFSFLAFHSPAGVCEMFGVDLCLACQICVCVWVGVWIYVLHIICVKSSWLGFILTHLLRSKYQSPLSATDSLVFWTICFNFRHSLSPLTLTAREGLKKQRKESRARERKSKSSPKWARMMYLRGINITQIIAFHWNRFTSEHAPLEETESKSA